MNPKNVRQRTLFWAVANIRQSSMLKISRAKPWIVLIMVLPQNLASQTCACLEINAKLLSLIAMAGLMDNGYPYFKIFAIREVNLKTSVPETSATATGTEYRARPML